MTRRRRRIPRAGATLIAAALSGLVLGGLGTTPASASNAAPAATRPATRWGVRAARAGSPTWVGIAVHSSDGYWLLDAHGWVAAAGAARPYGHPTGVVGRAVAIAADRADTGYWVATSSGQMFAFGSARRLGGTRARRLGSPVVALAVTADGRGYWLLQADGGLIAGGDARTKGSPRRGPAVGIARSAGGGYWVALADGTVAAYGGAPRLGGPGPARGPVRAIAATTDDEGYYVLTADGTVAAYGDARAFGGAPHGFGPVTLSGWNSGYRVASAAGSTYGFGLLTHSDAARAPDYPVIPNPPRNFPQPPGLDAACSRSLAACNRASLAAIDAARAAEGVRPMALPAGFARLGLAQQVLVVANAERTGRGLPPMRAAGPLDALAAAGAAANRDPSGPGGYAWGSNLYDGFPDALAADFLWMYRDGPGGANTDCRPGDMTGCWGHRDNILLPAPGAAGVGLHAPGPGPEQITELFAAFYR